MPEYQAKGAVGQVLCEPGPSFRNVLDIAVRHAKRRNDMVIVEGRGPGWPDDFDAWTELVAVHKDGKVQAYISRGKALLRTCGIEPDIEPEPIKLPDAAEATEHPTLQEVFENFRRVFDKAAADVLLAVDQAIKRSG